MPDLSMPPPFYDLEITDLSRGGAAVGRISDGPESGRVVLVPYALTGDQVRVKITRREKRVFHGQILEILRPSPDRQTPACSVFGSCGGCTWQHVPYALQWETKQKGIFEAAQRANLVLPARENWSLFAAPSAWNYRNRIQLHGDGEKLGFFRASSREIVDVTECPISRRTLNDALRALRNDPTQNPPPPFQVELDDNGSDVRRVYNARHGALGFRQVNDEQNENLKLWVSEQLEASDSILDLYGGDGNLSRLLAPSRPVWCVDLSVPTIGPKVSLTHPMLKYIRSDVRTWVRKAPKLPNEWTNTGVVLDPPREGLGEGAKAMVDLLNRLNVTTVVHVGCSVDAWVRDLGEFCAQGWRVERVGVFDFFPQTPHVESVAALKRVGV